MKIIPHNFYKAFFIRMFIGNWHYHQVHKKSNSITHTHNRTKRNECTTYPFTFNEFALLILRFVRS